MCGRFVLAASRRQVAEAMGLPGMPDVPPRYNIAPSQLVEAVYVERETGQRRAGLFRWGLVPSWAKDPKIGSRLINARAETLFDKPAFRGAARYHRCLIPAQGFYEWQAQPSGGKAPYFLTLADAGVMALAGLFEHYADASGQAIDSLTIVTRQATGVARLLHDRMPVILPSDSHGDWLAPGLTDRQGIEELLDRALPPTLAAVPVGTLVNRPDHDGPELIEPIGPALEEA